jgi:hypothetical protein
VPPHHPITAFQLFCTAPSLKHTQQYLTEQLLRTNVCSLGAKAATGGKSAPPARLAQAWHTVD